MRSVNLLKVAFDAELLRLRAMMARQGKRAAFAVVAVIFALAVLTLAEVIGWLALRLRLESIPATAILLGINLVVAAIFGVWRRGPRRDTRSRRPCGCAGRALDAARGTLALWDRPGDHDGLSGPGATMKN